MSDFTKLETAIKIYADKADHMPHLMEKAATALQDLSVSEGWMLESARSGQWKNSIKEAEAVLRAVMGDTE